MIAADGGNYDKEGKIFPPIIEKLGLGLKICNSSIRICRGNEKCWMEQLGRCELAH